MSNRYESKSRLPINIEVEKVPSEANQDINKVKLDKTLIEKLKIPDSRMKEL